MMQILDDPVWNALTGSQQQWALKHPTIKRYAPALAPFVGGQSALDELKDVVEPGEEIVFVGDMRSELSHDFSCLSLMNVHQMVFQGTPPDSDFDSRIVTLNASHAPDMMRLTDLAFPGYFRAATYKLGAYFGIYVDEKLVAMAGERMHIENWREVSAICTHPDYRGRGYARALTKHVMREILAEGLVPFLHVGESNAPAIRLYEDLGFRYRITLPVRRYSY